MDPQNEIIDGFPATNLYHEFSNNGETSRNQGISTEYDDDYTTENERNEQQTRMGSREQYTGQRNIREGLEQIRMSLDNTREGQTFLTVMKNVLPFFLLFSAKLVYDNLNAIAQFLTLYGFFFQADFYIRRCVIGGFPSNVIRIAYSSGFSILTILYFNTFSFPDFDFSNTFALNLLYFLRNEFEVLTMTSTLYGVLIVDTSFKLVTIIPKAFLLILSESLVSSAQKRRLLQVTEYCSELYRCALPFGPWLRFFLFVHPGSDIMTYFFAIIYFSLKVGEMYRYSLFVKKSLKNLLTGCSIGTPAKEFECQEPTCSVCCCDLSQPIKLECKHVFCKVCIETWLDQNTTCPICRAEVAKDVVL